MNELKLEDISAAFWAAESGAPLEQELGAALAIIDVQEVRIDDLTSDVDFLSSQIIELGSELERARA